MKARRLSTTFRELRAVVLSEASGFVKVRLFLALALVVGAAVLTALGPVALKLIVDGFTRSHDGARVSATLLIALYVASQWLARIIGELRGLVYARAERRMLRTLSERLVAHVMRLPLRFHLDRKTGALSQALDNGLQGYELILHHVVFTLLPIIAQLGTIVLVLARLNQPVFLALFCGALVVYAAAFSFATIRISGAASAASSAHVSATATITDSILNYETVKYFAAESLVQDKVSRALSRTEKEWVAFYRSYAMNGIGVATIFAVFLGAAVLYAVGETTAGHMSVGAFVLVNTYMLQVMQPVEMLGYAVQGVSQGAAMLEKMLALFREETEPPQEGAPALPSGPGRLEFRNVSIAYRADRVILKDVSFVVPAGKTVGIVGASGAGKSTIVRLLVRFFEPDCGEVLLDGTPISESSLREIRNAIAVVPQETVLFNDTIGGNIALGKPGCSQAEIEGAARVAHLHDFIGSLPDGYGTQVGERGVKLSGGEKQRVSIARAAIKRPRIYVFDEATSSLDSRSEREILRNLQEIARDSTTLVIAHRLSTVEQADEIAVLEDGRIVERGTHIGLLRQNGCYAALWRAQYGLGAHPDALGVSVA